jgi:hypothetical protein
LSIKFLNIYNKKREEKKMKKREGIMKLRGKEQTKWYK